MAKKKGSSGPYVAAMDHTDKQFSEVFMLPVKGKLKEDTDKHKEQFYGAAKISKSKK